MCLIYKKSREEITLDLFHLFYFHSFYSIRFCTFYIICAIPYYYHAAGNRISLWESLKWSLSLSLFHFSSLNSRPPEFIPQAFSIPLSQVIANDRTHRQRQDGYRQDHLHREEQKDSSDLVSSILQVGQLCAPSYVMVAAERAAAGLCCLS